MTAEGVAVAWATVRSEVLKDAVEVHLLPMLEAEARRLLKQRAEEGVLREAGRALRRVVETGTWVSGVTLGVGWLLGWLAEVRRAADLQPL
jgi:hypothetical protein